MTLRLLEGHVLDTLKELAPASVHCVVSSPPYWGLRDYNLPPQVWDAPEGRCAHVWGDETLRTSSGGLNSTTIGSGKGQSTSAGSLFTASQGAFCQQCGAWRGSLGLEPTIDRYVSHLVQVMAEVWRVLRDDGTLWCNLGDSYAAHPNQRSVHDQAGAKQRSNHASTGTPSRHVTGLKPKDLIGLPWRVAFALQEAGWWLRSAMTICKVACMPESVQGSRWEQHRVKVRKGRVARHGLDRGEGHVTESDVGERQDGAQWIDCPGCAKCAANDGLVLRMSAGRPTQATEMMFLLTKRETYFWDSEAVKESATCTPRPETSRNHDGTKSSVTGNHANGGTLGWNRPDAGRNMRNWFTVSPEPFPGAHFAVFGTKWIVPCIKAGTSARGCCSVCGAPWVRIVKRESYGVGAAGPGNRQIDGHSHDRVARGEVTRAGFSLTTTLGWRPSCAHDAPVVPCVILDPFGGAGTTALVAQRLGRDAILCELNPDYAKMARARVQGDMPLFYEEASADGVGGATLLAGLGRRAGESSPSELQALFAPRQETMSLFTEE